jgi:hypothetical protein
VARLRRLRWDRPAIRVATRHTALIEARAHVVMVLAKATQVGQGIGPAGVALFDVIHH